jgi:hypothetical protein|tara:strand:- start:1027 stop:1284 length:258 start_codon:yes stop_codon:yes gene_type:complete
MENAKPKWRNVGAIWKPKPNARSEGSGELTLNGMTQKFVIFKNEHKTSEKQPDYKLAATDDPVEAKEYTPRKADPAPLTEEDIPF